MIAANRLVCLSFASLSYAISLAVTISVRLFLGYTTARNYAIREEGIKSRPESEIQRWKARSERRKSIMTDGLKPERREWEFYTFSLVYTLRT